ncbi:isocitrate/isopropylmalate family dehydrogenase [Chloroflexota bacterium]
MMLRYSCGLAMEAGIVEAAVDEILGENYRTYDIMDDGMTRVGTKEMGDLIAGKIRG